DLDQPPLAAPAEGSSEAGPPSGDRAPQPLAVHSQGRGSLERHGEAVLGRPPDDESVGQRGVLRLPGGSPYAVRADAEGRTRLSRIRLFELMAGRPVAEYQSALLAVQIGPVRVW